MANPRERGWLRENRRLWRFIIWGGLGVLLAMFVPALLPKGMGTVAYSAVSFGLPEDVKQSETRLVRRSV